MKSIFGKGIFLAAALAALISIACFSGRSSPSPPPASTATVPPPPTPAPTASPLSTASPAPTSTPVAEVRGFRYPIAGACLPTSPSLLPNAPRPYRLGIHEGIDFYDGFACVPIRRGTPVLAAKGGQVLRADTDYVEMTAEERDRLLTISQNQGYTDAAALDRALDRFRGRQVWIDHGGGVVTRYAHLSAIADGISAGVFVEVGQVIGFVGNSGTPDGVTNPDAEIHLHLEIRVGETYLGQGLSLEEMLRVLEQAFSP